jgi:hypothetical protein
VRLRQRWPSWQSEIWTPSSSSFPISPQLEKHPNADSSTLSRFLPHLLALWRQVSYNRDWFDFDPKVQESTNVAREASFFEAKAQHLCRTGVERRCWIIICRWQAVRLPQLVGPQRMRRRQKLQRVTKLFYVRRKYQTSTWRRLTFSTMTELETRDAARGWRGAVAP